jgi:F-type H+-transporting ATPase subunit c
MANLDPEILVALVTIVVAGVGIIIGTLTPAIVEGRAVLKAFDSMARQPEIADQVRNTLIVAMALLETTAIYALLIMLALIFANPLIDRIFAGG